MNAPSLRRYQQAGFTLVELMVSMVIGLLIVLALVVLLANVNRNNSEMTKTNSQIENGRFALQLLESDIVHAGYWGGFVPSFDDLTTDGIPSDLPNAVPDPCLAYTTPWSVQDKANFIGIALQSYEIPATVPSPTLSVCADKVTNPKANTDVLFIRHLETCVPGAVNCPEVNEGDLYFQVNRCNDIPTPPTPPASYAWAPYPAASAASSPAAVFPLKNRFTAAQASCNNAGVAELRKFVSHLYYIRDYSNTVDDGIPTLMRSEFGIFGGALVHKSAEQMIEGIEGFRVEFGIDNISDSGADITASYGTVPTGVNCSNAADPKYKCSIDWAATTPPKTSPINRGDGIPDGAFVRCTNAVPCTATQLTHVVAVKVYVLARSKETSPGFIDTKTYKLGSTTLGPFTGEQAKYKRHVYSTTIRLTNVSGRRETPP